MKKLVIALLFASIAAPALAQDAGFGTLTYSSRSRGFVDRPVSPTDFIPIYGTIYGTMYNGAYGPIETEISAVPIGRFASRADLNSMAVFAYAARRDAARAVESAALAAAMTVVPPNPGDRFSFTVSGAALDGASAGSVSFSYRAANYVLLFGGYARSQTQNLVKGGASFSFR